MNKQFFSCITILLSWLINAWPTIIFHVFHPIVSKSGCAAFASAEVLREGALLRAWGPRLVALTITTVFGS